MSNSHIVPMPKGFIVVRILQILFAVIVVALTAFLVSRSFGFVHGATAYGIFLGILTLIVVIYDIVAERAAPKAYNMWAVLALDIVMVIFWLSAMGSLAAYRASFTLLLHKRQFFIEATDGYLHTLAGAAGVAAIELVLFIISLVMFSVRLHRHRTANGQNGVTNINVTPQKIELQQNPQAAYYSQPPPGAPMQPNYQPPVLQPQHTGSSGFTPVSPVQAGQVPYQQSMSPPPQQIYTPATSPPPQFSQPAPQYPLTSPPQGYHEAPGQQYGPR